MNNSAPVNPRQPILSEEWVAVGCGFLIITLFLIGLRVPYPVFLWSDGLSLLGIFSRFNVLFIVAQFIVLLVVVGVAAILLRKSTRKFLLTFCFVYFITLIALILAGSTYAKHLNLEPVIFSLLIGLLIGNVFHMPDWIRRSLSAELFVKIGLVLLGTTVIFSDLLKAGMTGLVQALLVVIAVWYFAYWVSKKFGIEEELNLMLASAVSICGVSAAIATAGAIKGDPKKLSYVISLVLITAIPMMLFMPPIAAYLNLSQEVTGAWIGGTIDTTGAVVAAGTLAGEAALKTSTIVKFSQNVLLGLAAFAISIYWTYTKNASTEKPSLKLIWDRFPKFVIGFVFASLLFSFFIDTQVVAEIKDGLKSFQTMFFTLAFTSIGLETRFSDLFTNQNKKPLYAFLIAQAFNIVITLAIAWMLFR